MPEFLAETCAPGAAPGAAAPRTADIALAAGQDSQDRTAARFLGAVAVPSEETCYLFESPPPARCARRSSVHRLQY
jgi:hypothetical protein